MAAFVFYDPRPVFFDLLSTAPLTAGSLTFYDLGTTNPRDTWSDPDMAPAHLNPNPVNLDSAGRPSVAIFLDGDYTIKLTDGLNGTGATIWTADVVPGADAAFTIPPLVNGQFLTNDGATLQWSAIIQVPDPTGQNGKVLTSTGAGTTWTTLPSAPTLDIVVAANSQRVGDGVSTNKALTQGGTATAPATGTPTTTQAVVFTTTYTTTPIVIAQPTSNSQPGGPVVVELTAISTTGFTARFDVAEGNSGNANIVNPVPFNWIAFGNKTVP